MKKILVSGCVNCPYLTIWYDGGEDINYISRGICNHPSFPKSLQPPTIGCNVLLSYNPNTGEIDGIHPNRTPDWCPLSDDVKIE